MCLDTEQQQTFAVAILRRKAVKGNNELSFGLQRKKFSNIHFCPKTYFEDRLLYEFDFVIFLPEK